MKRLYNWVLNWAGSSYSAVALFFLAFTESVFFPVPADILLIALCLGSVSKSFRYALICTIGSVSGALIGYSIGSLIWMTGNKEYSDLARFFFDNIPGFSLEMFNNIKTLFNKNDFWVILTAGFTPVPFKVFTVTAGAFDLNLLMFFTASAISRGARYFIISWLIWKSGPGIKSFIDRYFNLVAYSVAFCLIGVILILNYLI